MHLVPETVETNLVWIRIDPSLCTAADLVQRLRQRGILVHPLGPYAVRACTHLDVTTPQILRAAETLVKTVAELSGKPVGTARTS